MMAWQSRHVLKTSVFVTAGTAGLLCLALGGCGESVRRSDTSTTPAPGVEICDGRENTELARAIAAELGTSEDARLSRDELDAVTYLTVDGLGSFEGFQCLPNLQRLVVGANAASDLAPLSGLSGLADLAITGSVAPNFRTLTEESQALTSSLVRLSVRSRVQELAGLGALRSSFCLMSGNWNSWTIPSRSFSRSRGSVRSRRSIFSAPRSRSWLPFGS